MADATSIKGQVRSAFRDFTVEGVPVSGVHEPVKSEIRAALEAAADRIEDVAANASNGVRGYGLISQMPVLTAEENGTLAKVEEDGQVYRWEAPAWSVFADPTIAAAIRAEAAADIATASEADIAALKVDAADRTQKTTSETLEVLGSALFAAGAPGWLIGQADPDGNTHWGVRDDGTLMLSAALSLGGAEVRLVHGAPTYSFAVTDEQNNVHFGQLADGGFVPQAGGGSGEALDADNLALRDRLPMLAPEALAFDADYNVLPIFGQSLAVAAEGWPALSKTAVAGTVMLGNSMTPVSFANAVFEPLGGAAFVPMVANVRSGTAILTDAEVSALVAGDQASGENPAVAWSHGVRRRLRSRWPITDAQRQIASFAPGRGGETIEALSKGRVDGVAYYDRFTDGLGRMKTLASVAGKTLSVAAIAWMQGESNYSVDGVGTTTRAGYKTLLNAMVSNLQADSLTISGQIQPPVFLTYQTGAAYTVDHDENGTPDLSIGMAQWELSRERLDVVMVGPTYVFTDKRDNTNNGHLDANGYRWFGEFLAKATDFMQRTGRKWRPLEPVSVSTLGTRMRIGFYVPVPPLRTQTIYDKYAPVSFPDMGFRVSDDEGEIGITSVNIISQTVVEIYLAREPGGATGRVWYADKTFHMGGGNLCDSDAAVGLSRYEYHAGSGQYAEANIPELVDKPYPLRNACIAFILPVNWSI